MFFRKEQPMNFTSWIDFFRRKDPKKEYLEMLENRLANLQESYEVARRKPKTRTLQAFLHGQMIAVREILDELKRLEGW